MSDQKQRQQALDIRQSFIVQAPAGSGKTELLAQRYLKLLSVCQRPEQVWAMTFTNEAAHQLKQRILINLQQAGGVAPKEAHKKQTFDLATAALNRSHQLDWQLLQHPEQLKITTIDSLANQVARHHQDKTQLVYPPMEDWQANLAYQQAAHQTIDLIDDVDYRQAIVNVLTHLDNNIGSFVRLISNMLAKRDQWLRHIAGASCNVRYLSKRCKAWLIRICKNLMRRWLKF